MKVQGRTEYKINRFNSFAYNSFSKKNANIKFGQNIASVHNLESILQKKLKLRRFLASIIGAENNPKAYNLEKLDGIQKGIKIFEGLSLKEIGFISDKLHHILAIRGCFNNCSYCYAGAKKIIKRADNFTTTALFEDLKALFKGYEELKNRSGIDFFYSAKNKQLQSLVFDSDNIEVAIPDKNRNIHEFPEINRLIYKLTGMKGIFDTSGWATKSEKYQKRAERIVGYYAKDNNIQELYQFNISINPFHGTLEKVKELKKQGKKEVAERIYQKHIERITNALFTCIPISAKEEFNTIKRAINDNVPNMDGYYARDELKLLNDIFIEFSNQCKQDLATNKKYIKTEKQLDDVLKIYKEKLGLSTKTKIEDDIETGLTAGAKLEQLIKENNPDMDDIGFARLFSGIIHTNEDLYNLKTKRKYNSSSEKYNKIIDVNGKIYLTDNYTVIPTDIQLNFLNREKSTQPFSTAIKDYIFTKNKI